MTSQGPFNVIVHKLSDVIVEAEYDSQSQQLLSNFQVTFNFLECEEITPIECPVTEND